MKTLERAIDGLSNGLLALGCVALAAMMFLACANMILRTAGEPIKGTVELMEFLGALVVAFGLAATQRKKGHIALTIMSGKFPKVLERAIDALTSLASCGLFGLVAWRIFRLAMKKMESGELAETLRFPFYPIMIAVGVGVAVLALALAWDILDMMRCKNKQESGS
ncbi:MAG: TRAP transporter small permease [Desulfovibrio sp.]|nr:MAG: TRAP transporter small permease [Desulfovibrio sp.]